MDPRIRTVRDSCFANENLSLSGTIKAKLHDERSIDLTIPRPKHGDNSRYSPEQLQVNVFLSPSGVIYENVLGGMAISSEVLIATREALKRANERFAGTAHMYLR
jgi:hypothetical protein